MEYNYRQAYDIEYEHEIVAMANELQKLTVKDRVGFFQFDPKAPAEESAKVFRVFERYYLGATMTHPLCETHRQQDVAFVELENHTIPALIQVGSKDMGKTQRRINWQVYMAVNNRIRAYVRVSYAKMNATNTIDEIFNYLVSDKIIQDYGDILDEGSMRSRSTKHKKKVPKRSGYFATRMGGHFLGIGVSRSISGIRLGGMRPTTIDFDDHITDDTLTSPAKYTSVIKRVSETATSLGQGASISHTFNLIDNDSSIIVDLLANPEVKKVFFKYNEWSCRVVATDEEAHWYNKGIPNRAHHFISEEHKIREIQQAGGLSNKMARAEYYRYYRMDLSHLPGRMFEGCDDCKEKVREKDVIKHGKWRIYTPTIDKGTIIYSIDPASGLGRDNFVCVARDVNTNRIQAVWCDAETTPLDACEQIDEIAQQTEDKYFAIERNRDDAVVDYFVKRYGDRVIGEVGADIRNLDRWRKKLQPGIFMTDGKRRMAIGILQQMIEGKSLRITDESLLTELKTITEDKMQTRDAFGGHYDRCMALIISIIGERSMRPPRRARFEIL